MSMIVSLLLVGAVSLAVGFLLGHFYRARRDPLKDFEGRLRSALESVASSALSQSTTELIKLSEEKFKALMREGELRLESKKELIDANLKEMGTTLKGLAEKSTRLEEGLHEGRQETEKLRSTAEGLRLVLSSSQARGQWGERMVEDILSVLGLVEGINYLVQHQLESGEQPDYTFLLPKDKRINLDVKFPIDQYEKYLGAESEAEAAEAKKLFLTAVKNHIKDVAGRGYVNPAEGTVDYVMIFIPNESIYGFIHQSYPELLDFALEKHIILCSPITLYAVLSLIHEAVRSFSVEQRAGEIMSELAVFQKQWDEYVGKMDKLGRSLDSAKGDYDNLVTTRTKALEKPLQKIQELQEGQQADLLED